MSEMAYWYSYSFVHGDDQGTTYASTYIGYKVTEPPLITFLMIEEAKVAAGVPLDSVLLSVCYLGLGTQDDFSAATRSPAAGPNLRIVE